MEDGLVSRFGVFFEGFRGVVFRLNFLVKFFFLKLCSSRLDILLYIYLWNSFFFLKCDSV